MITFLILWNNFALIFRREKFSFNAVGTRLYVFGGYEKIPDRGVEYSAPEVCTFISNSRISIKSSILPINGRGARVRFGLWILKVLNLHILNA